MIFKCKVAHIVAVGNNGEIGKDNGMLWNIPEDFKYFREKTLGHAMIMGRNTYDSIPEKLSRRSVHVVSKKNCNPTWIDPIDNALGRASGSCFHLNTNIIWVAGGQQVYESTNDIVDEVYITRVHANFPEADTFYKMPDGFKFDGYTRPSHDHLEKTDSYNHKIVPVTFEKWVRK